SQQLEKPQDLSDPGAVNERNVLKVNDDFPHVAGQDGIQTALQGGTMLESNLALDAYDAAVPCRFDLDIHCLFGGNSVTFPGVEQWGREKRMTNDEFR